MNNILILSVIIAVAQAAIWRDIQKIKPGEPYVCEDDDGKIYEPGATWYPKGECERRECSAHSGNTVEIVGASCGVAVGPDGWEMVSDMTKKYPHCCPEPKRPRI